MQSSVKSATRGIEGVYLDTAILVKLLVRERDSAFYVHLVDREMVWSSQIATTECFSALLRKEREGAISPTHRRAAWRQVETDVADARLALVPVAPSVLERANTVLERVHGTVALRSLDAIHLASAEHCASWPLCSSDARVRAAANLLAMPLTPLPG
jgi:predicted nucleic acid-binding protein